MIHRRHREIAFLVSWLVTEVGPGVAARVPGAFLRIDIIEAIVVALIKANVIENIKFDLRSPVAGVGDAS